MSEGYMLSELVSQLAQLQKIIKESPEVLTLLTLAKDARSPAFISSQRSDVLVEASQAARVLKVSPMAIHVYHKKGLLPAYYVPESSHRKFWLSDVMGLARREEVKQDDRQ